MTHKKLKYIENGLDYELFFKNIGDALFVNHLNEDNSISNFIKINDQACELLNYSVEELLNLNIYDFISIREHQKFKQYLDQLITDGYIIFEFDLISKNGPKIPVEINARLFEYNNKQTIVSVVRDNTRRSQAHNQLSKSSEQLRKLALRLQSIREEERTLIAREIHDELGQLLTVLKIQISLISKKLINDQQKVNDHIEASIKFIDQAVQFVKKITTQLRPGVLDELGLIPAIEWQAKEFEQSTGIRCKCFLPEKPIELLSEHSTALFRITQEALTNVARHSLAERVSIYLKNENKKLILEITDNGKGIHKFQIDNPNSLGLLGIKERAMVFGGTVSIYSVPDQGTNLKVEWPL